MIYHVTTRAALPLGLARLFLPPAWPRRRAASAQSGEPIKIGFSMALTGPLAPTASRRCSAPRSGKRRSTPRAVCSAARSNWSTTTTSPIRRTCPASTPSCSTSTKSISWSVPTATNMMAPAMPVVMQKGKTFVGLFALDVNSEFHYPKYFSMLPSGPKPREAFTEGFFQVAAAQNPKPKTVALVPRTPSSRATPAKAPATTPRNTASRSSTTRPFRRTRRTSRRSSARCRPPTRISWWFARIR